MHNNIFHTDIIGYDRLYNLVKFKPLKWNGGHATGAEGRPAPSRVYPSCPSTTELHLLSIMFL